MQLLTESHCPRPPGRVETSQSWVLRKLPLTDCVTLSKLLDFTLRTMEVTDGIKVGKKHNRIFVSKRSHWVLGREWIEGVKTIGGDPIAPKEQ